MAKIMGNSVGSVAVTVIATVLLFGALIFIHELGHYLTARLFKVTVREFSVGMGPKIWGKTSKKTGILYALRAIPIGGYVAMVGEDEESEDPNAFHRKKVWQRMIITAAGGAMNLILGILLTVVYVLSMSTHYGTTVTAFPEGAYSASSAEALEVGDEIRKIGSSSVRTGYEIVYELFRAGGQTERQYETENGKTAMKIDLTVLRNGEEKVLHDVSFPVVNNDGIGYALRDFYYDEHPKTFSSVMLNTARQVRLSVKMVYESLYDLITGKYGIKMISGPIGTAGAVGEAIKSDAAHEEGTDSNTFLYLCMMITVNLGLFNLLPIPALDGGRLFFQFIELIFRRPVPAKVEGIIHTSAMILLLAFMAVIAVKDIVMLIIG
ncbi:MAG: site-2 protease family protein [Clostridia bacterium]|nr:site-2 protease family protein [Clostridia bacterium]